MPATIKPVTAYLMENVGKQFHFNDMMAALPEGSKEASVRAAILKLKERGFDIDVVVPGAVYQFNGLTNGTGGDKKADRLFEQIGTTKDGSPILQAEDGALFIARKIN